MASSEKHRWSLWHHFEDRRCQGQGTPLKEVRTLVKPAEELRGLISYGRGTEGILCHEDHWMGHFGAIPWHGSSSNTRSFLGKILSLLKDE